MKREQVKSSMIGALALIQARQRLEIQINSGAIW